MKYALSLFFLLWFGVINAQSKKEYLKSNRFDLRDDSFRFPTTDFKIIGFGAYHGSAKTEEVEQVLMNALIAQGAIDYYLPETDFSTALYFNDYLKTGDTVLLKDLVTYAGIRVPQDRSIETYEKWKALRAVLTVGNHTLEVVGIDKIINYKYALIHLMDLLKQDAKSVDFVMELNNVLETDTLDLAAYYNSNGKNKVKEFVKQYEAQQDQLKPFIIDKEMFDEIVFNIKATFSDEHPREELIFRNYTHISSKYQFDSKPQFVRFGFFHLEKAREGKHSNPSFFAQLIEKKVYDKDQVVSVIGYLTKSRVLWQEEYDEENNYTGSITKGGFGIGDYWKEYFRGIRNLKRTQLSDLTLFKLNGDTSPYNEKKPDLMEIKMFFSASNSKQVKGMSTLEFMDFAVLISDSKANRPIVELNH